MTKRAARVSALCVAACLLGHVLLWPASITAQDMQPVREAVVGDALLTEGAYKALGTMTDRFGPRLMGTPGNIESLDWLESELNKLGLETHREAFDFVGWVREEDRVQVTAPFERELRAIAMGYTDAQPPVEAELVFLDNAAMADFDASRYAGKVALLPATMRFTPQQQRDLGNVVGIVGILATNRKNGGQLLARGTNHTGEVFPFPQFSITEEEGRWLERLLESGETVRVRLEVNSHVESMVGENLVARIPAASAASAASGESGAWGESGKRIILGAHFDSWDLGQGAMDNGLGVSQLFEIARLIKKHHPDNLHTIEFVWFNAEELGLWGSKAYVARHEQDLDSVYAMINFDMAGKPIQLNAMGFSELVPVLEKASSRLGNWSFDKPVANKTWLGSDHHPFILAGVPTATFNAPIDEESVRFYHDFGDTFEKIDRKMLAQGTAVFTLVVLDLANEATPLRRYDQEEVKKIFVDAGLEERMRAAEAWPFPVTSDQ